MPSLESPSPPGYTRLHITPLDQSLLNVVIPSAVLPHARNISFHTIETFPERRYGYVELPAADADKLKKKLNGLVLKGEKMRIDKARPKSEPVGAADPDVKVSKKDKKEKKEKKEKSSKKRKREENVVQGVELEDRKIKRGWTLSEQEMIKEKRKERANKDHKSKDSTKDKKSKEKKRELKSKYTDNPECLFRTKLPSKKSKAKDGDDDTDDAAHSRKKRRKDDNTVIVHEFEKTTKHPSFLRATKATQAEALTFQDGVGWVDAEGNVVEKVTSTRPDGSARSSKSESSKSKSKKTKPAPEPESEAEDTSSSEGSSSEEDEGEDAPTPKQDAREESKESAAADDDDDDTSSSGTSSSGSDDESEDDSPSEPENKVATPIRSKKLDISTVGLSSPSVAAAAAKSEVPSATRPRSSGSINSLTIKIPQSSPAAAPAENAVHPLEALYKRAPQDGTTTPKASKPFSFFGNDDGMDIEEDEEADEDKGSTRKKNLHLQPPMTPYTREDFEFRNVRSAAPTPDTAHPSRSASFASFWASSSGDRDDNDDDNDDIPMREHTPTATATSSAVVQPTIPEEDEEEEYEQEEQEQQGEGAALSSDFQKQFWENRGDLNRKWRKRKRDAAKERRYRDNRARAERAI